MAAQTQNFTPPNPTRIQRLGAASLLGLRIGGAAGGIIGVFIGGVGVVENSDPTYPFRTMIDQVVGCSTIDDAKIERFHEALQPPQITASRVSNSRKVPADVVAERRAEKYGVRLAPLSNTIIDRMLGSTPQEALAQANQFTLEEYGFSTVSHDSNPERARNDAVDLIVKTHVIPTELIRGVTKQDLSTVILGEEKTIDKTKVGGLYEGDKKTITLIPEQVGVFSHELGHAIAATSSRNHCVRTSAHNTPTIEKPNPPGFKYGGNIRAEDWQGTTLDGHASDNPAEDIATTAGRVIGDSTEETQANTSLRSTPVIEQKAAITLATIGEVDEKSALFYADRVSQLP